MVWTDALFWNYEQSNMGALASAGWRSGWAAFQEFQTDRECEESTGTGRADLYLQSHQWEDHIEAKMAWCHDGRGRRCQTIRQGLDNACDQVRALQLGDEETEKTQRIGVVFPVPSLPETDQRDRIIALSPLIDCIEAFDGPDAVAWCFPTRQVLPQLVWKKRVYSGVLLLAKLCCET
jgi:hypothetical protein